VPVADDELTTPLPDGWRCRPVQRKDPPARPLSRRRGRLPEVPTTLLLLGPPRGPSPSSPASSDVDVPVVGEPPGCGGVLGDSIRSACEPAGDGCRDVCTSSAECAANTKKDPNMSSGPSARFLACQQSVGLQPARPYP